MKSLFVSYNWRNNESKDCGSGFKIYNDVGMPRNSNDVMNLLASLEADNPKKKYVILHFIELNDR